MTATLRWLHALACHRKGLLAAACAYGDCQLPGLWRHAYAVTEDEGTTSYVFCRPGHRKAWRSQAD